MILYYREITAAGLPMTAWMMMHQAFQYETRVSIYGRYYYTCIYGWIYIVKVNGLEGILGKSWDHIGFRTVVSHFSFSYRIGRWSWCRLGGRYRCKIAGRGQLVGYSYGPDRNRRGINDLLWVNFVGSGMCTV